MIGTVTDAARVAVIVQREVEKGVEEGVMIGAGAGIGTETKTEPETGPEQKTEIERNDAGLKCADPTEMRITPRKAEGR